MLLAAPFLLPRGAGVKGAKKFYRNLRRKGQAAGEGGGGESLPAPPHLPSSSLVLRPSKDTRPTAAA
jgi:hypothetical protein